MTDSKEQPEILLSENDNAFSLRLTLSADNVECFASIHDKAPAENLTPPTLRSFLERFHIVSPDLPAIASFCLKIKNDECPITSTLVAKGTEPQKGKDETLELTTPPVPPPLPVDENGRVDLKTVHVFDNVEPGQKIAVILPATQGADGTSVTGTVIPGLLGDPTKRKIGSGIRHNHETGELFAEISGRIVEKGNTLTVSPTYEVSTVDYEIGNIMFKGEVKVYNDVLDGFDVRATGKISVLGNVGGCSIEGGEDIEIGTVAGQNRGLIRCEGTLTADNLIDAEIECEGDVVVRHEIRNSVVKSRGKVLVGSGVVAGGQITALKGIEVDTVGTISGLSTHLLAGIDYEIAAELALLRSRITETEMDITSAARLIDGMKKRIRPGEEVPFKLENLMNRQNDRKEKWQEMVNRMEGLLARETPGANGKINIHNQLFEGVTLSLGEVTTLIRSDREGPLSIIEHPDRQTLKSFPLSDLDLTADELREEFTED